MQYFIFLVLFRQLTIYFYWFILVRASDKRIANEGEYSDSEDEGEGRRDEKNHKSPRKKVRTASPIQNMVTDATKKEGDATVVTTAVTTPPTTSAPTSGSAAEKPQNGAKGADEPAVKTEKPADSKEEYVVPMP